MGAAVMMLIGLLVYTYVGYPIVLGVLAALTRRRADGDVPAELPMISACLPVFNGASYLPAKLQSLLEQDYPADRLEILVYCDGCTDETEKIARAIAEAPASAGRIRVFVDARRLGKPTGLNTLVPAARGELLLLNDVRQPLSANAVRSMAAAFRDPGVGCATGNLVLAGGAGSGVYWRYETWLRRQESRFRGVVGMTGPIAMVRRADMEPLPADLILDDVWIPMRLALAGKRVAFVDEARATDAAFENEREFKRKVRTLAGNYQLFARLPALLLPFRNPIWFETVSHKLLRLLAPWVMLAVAALSIDGALFGDAGTAPLMRVLVVGQLAFYGLAAVGQRGGKLANVARTFVVLNAAALVGLWRHLTGRQRVTW